MNKKPSIDSWFKRFANLKKTIGVVYLLIAGGWLFLFIVSDNLALRRLFFCYFSGFLGLTVRALIIYGVFIKDEKRELKEKEIKECMKNYIVYGGALFAIVSFIYLTSYRNFNEMDWGVFVAIAFGLFFLCGIAIVHVIENFLNKTKIVIIKKT